MLSERLKIEINQFAIFGGNALLKRYKILNHYIHSRHNKLNRSYVLVAGVQRSGTNMVMDVLERSLDTDTYHEKDQRAFFNYEMREMEVIHRLAGESKARYFVIKALCELHVLDKLLDDLHPAKAIWVVRNYNDVVNSMLKSFPSQSAVIQRLVNDPLSNRWVGKGMSETTHELISQFHKKGINDASGAALIWYLRNILFFEKGYYDDDRINIVFYEDLVNDPRTVFMGIHDFLGIKLTPYATKNIYSSSVGKRCKPDIEDAIVEKCDGLLNRFVEQNLN